ncbi:hypothetical protein V6N12_019682 [Hibiscus sabdariffa]|uniref:RNase H type-1 domain-containing protein n=1 Tax=Hibiscus sabdariffa TaxID=183260 RepID=A0ABR2B507_9ROSI
MVLDADFVERKSVLDRGNRFIEECKTAYSQMLLVPMVVQRRKQWWEGPQRGWVKANICNGLSSTLQHGVLVSTIHDLLQRSWQVRIRHVGRSGNAVADKLARLGQQCMLQGSYFAAPAVEVVGLVGEEQHRWEDHMMGS